MENSIACLETKRINFKELCGWNLLSNRPPPIALSVLVLFLFFNFDFIAQNVQGVSTLFTLSLSAHYWFTGQ